MGHFIEVLRRGTLRCQRGGSTFNTGTELVNMEKRLTFATLRLKLKAFIQLISDDDTARALATSDQALGAQAFGRLTDDRCADPEFLSEQPTRGHFGAQAIFTAKNSIYKDACDMVCQARFASEHAKSIATYLIT